MNKNLFKSLLLATGIFFFSDTTFATKHNISVADFAFTPATMTVNVGDTVIWTLMGGFHTTTSLTIPPAAQPWDTMLSTTYSYIVTVAGTYTYECTIHTGMMSGQFTAVVPTAIPNTGKSPFRLGPNPATNELKLSGNVKHMNITAYDLSGHLVRELQIISDNSSEKVYSLEGMIQGYYMLYIKADNVLFKEKLMIVR